MVTDQEIEDWKRAFLAENVRSRRTAMAFDLVDRLVAKSFHLQRVGTEYLAAYDGIQKGGRVATDRLWAALKALRHAFAEKSVDAT